MYKENFFFNSAINTFVWKKKKVRAISIYQDFFLGNREENNSSRVDFFDKTTQTWCITSTFRHKLHKIKKKYELFFFSFNYFFFKKFKFIGKGYKIKKVRNKKTFQLFFGYSHKIFLISGGCQLRKLMKYKLFLITNNARKLNKVTLIVQNIRRLNMFTKRGLRALKQKIFKRPGKKSTY